MARGTDLHEAESLDKSSPLQEISADEALQHSEQWQQSFQFQAATVLLLARRHSKAGTS
jgi:hypothetical protein